MHFIPNKRYQFYTRSSVWEECCLSRLRTIHFQCDLLLNTAVLTKKYHKKLNHNAILNLTKINQTRYILLLRSHHFRKRSNDYILPLRYLKTLTPKWTYAVTRKSLVVILDSWWRVILLFVNDPISLLNLIFLPPISNLEICNYLQL